MKPLKVIDLFAGPGGLGEGFSAYRTPEGEQAFKIALSIEKEASAHRTLLLRAMFRQYPDGDAPEAYYAFLRGELGDSPEEQLYKLPELQDALASARREAQAIELGVTDKNQVDQKIRDALGGEDFVLIGGPPCQAYSLVGRARNIGDKSRIYNPDEDHRNFLYKEYLEVIAKFQPSVFVMENVKGMISARTSEGPVFPKIRKDLSDPCGSSGLKYENRRGMPRYRILSFVVGAQNELFDHQEAHGLAPQDFVIKAEQFGIPQARHRVILLGIREDLMNGRQPAKLTTTSAITTVKDALSGLPQLRSGLSKEEDNIEVWREIPQRTVNSLKNSHSPINANLLNRLYRKYSDFYIAHNMAKRSYSRGGEFGLRAQYNEIPAELRAWYLDTRMKGFITNHSSRAHIRGDLARYWFAAAYQQITGRSPKAKEFPSELWPAHANFGSGKFVDRFRVQGAQHPASTITSHISKDGHYFIHADPRQMRSLTVREAARLQTFPDNYHFVGSRTDQYVQVGNAVPPMLAAQIAGIIADFIHR